ncbi:MAG: hypothetical protein IKH58_00950 [Bacteroidales bacterium]|nr:hypothetical protein [Bacteroidales bacterium]
MKCNQAFCRPTEYFRNWRKHYDGRQNASSNRIRYSDGRQSVSAVGESIMMGYRVLAATG